MEVSDKAKYVFDRKAAYSPEWIRKNGICFESVYADTGQSDKQVYQSVVKDMDRLLGLSVRWEKRKEKVMVLVRTAKVDKIKNKTLSTIIYYLNQQESTLCI